MTNTWNGKVSASTDQYQLLDAAFFKSMFKIVSVLCVLAIQKMVTD